MRTPSTRLLTKFLLLPALALLVACGGGGSDPEPTPPEPTPTPDPEVKFTTFRLPASANSDKLTLSAEGAISGNNVVVTAQEWLDPSESKSFVATFATEPAGATVKVGGVTQTNNATANNFATPVTYTVTSGSTTTTYTVTFRMPQNSGLPLVMVTTDGGVEPENKTTYINGSVKIVDADNPGFNATHDMGIRLRGNSTMVWEKKPFRIKLNSKSTMFDYATAKSWVLLANYSDLTMLMNAVAFKLGETFGLPFTHKDRPVELFLNGRYKGSYQFTQHMEVATGRVDIDKKNDFLLELDNYYDEEWQFRSEKYNLPVMIKSPDKTDPKDAEIKAKFLALETAMKSTSFSYNNIKNLIDIPSVIDYLMLHEIVMNTEGKYPKSMYMRFIQSENKFYMGPIWDFDSGYGWKDMHAYWEGATSGPWFRKGSALSGTGATFLLRFFDDPTFRAEYKARWNAKKAQIDQITTFIDARYAQMKVSASMNYAIWYRYPGTVINPTGAFSTIPYDDAYAAEIGRMKTFLTSRIAFLNTEINKW